MKIKDGRKPTKLSSFNIDDLSTFYWLAYECGLAQTVSNTQLEKIRRKVAKKTAHNEIMYFRDLLRRSKEERKTYPRSLNKLEAIMETFGFSKKNLGLTSKEMRQFERIDKEEKPIIVE
jgi:hypothetical protein